MLIPSIDLMGGRVVQLQQGERLAIASDDLEGWIEKFSAFQIVQLIDLDAAMGRPANDGNTHVWYTLLEAREEGLGIELVPLAYDHQALAAEMRREGLPEEFVETILTGWWTTCLEILPARERAASRF